MLLMIMMMIMRKSVLRLGFRPVPEFLNLPSVIACSVPVSECVVSATGDELCGKY